MNSHMQVEEGIVWHEASPKAWYGRIDSFLMSMGFVNSKVYPNLYFKVIEDELVILLLYVDDIFLTRNEK